MTPSEVREHNDSCDDTEIIWCDCDQPEPLLLTCALCGGAIEGAIILADKVPNASGNGPEAAG